MINTLRLKIKKISRLQTLVILISCALPIQIMGRAAIACTLLLAFFYFLSLPQKITYLKRTISLVRTPIGFALFIMALLWIPNIGQSSDPIRSLEAGARTFFFIGLTTLFWSILIDNKIINGLLCRSFVIACGISILIKKRYLSKILLKINKYYLNMLKSSGTPFTRY